MPRLSQSVPKYRKHKASGQAIVTLNGRDIYLGPWRSKISRLEYDRRISEWLAGGRNQPPSDAAVRLQSSSQAIALRFGSQR